MRGRRLNSTCPYCGETLLEDTEVDGEPYRVFNCGTYFNANTNETERMCSERIVQKCYTEGCETPVIIREFTGKGKPRVLCFRCRSTGASHCGGYADMSEDGAGFTVTRMAVFT